MTFDSLTSIRFRRILSFLAGFVLLGFSLITLLAIGMPGSVLGVAFAPLLGHFAYLGFVTIGSFGAVSGAVLLAFAAAVVTAALASLFFKKAMSKSLGMKFDHEKPSDKSKKKMLYLYEYDITKECMPGLFRGYGRAVRARIMGILSLVPGIDVLTRFFLGEEWLTDLWVRRENAKNQPDEIAPNFRFISYPLRTLLYASSMGWMYLFNPIRWLRFLLVIAELVCADLLLFAEKFFGSAPIIGSFLAFFPKVARYLFVALASALDLALIALELAVDLPLDLVRLPLVAVLGRQDLSPAEEKGCEQLISSNGNSENPNEKARLQQDNHYLNQMSDVQYQGPPIYDQSQSPLFYQQFGQNLTQGYGNQPSYSPLNNGSQPQTFNPYRVLVESRQQYQIKPNQYDKNAQYQQVCMPPQSVCEYQSSGNYGQLNDIYGREEFLLNPPLCQTLNPYGSRHQ